MIKQKYGSATLEKDGNVIYKQKNRLLFRGQSNHEWKIQTTLERASGKKYDVLSYMGKVSKTLNQIQTFTDKKWDFPKYPEIINALKEESWSLVKIPAYDYLVYLRHHGYPSPLLDWTSSPYIAAFFAYSSAGDVDPAIYCYIDCSEFSKMGISSAPQIQLMGPHVTAHKRHFIQQASYTIATQWDAEKERHIFCDHHAIFENPLQESQDILIKIIMPSKLKTEVLNHLDSYNINDFSLFQTEDALVKTMVFRSFEDTDPA